MMKMRRSYDRLIFIMGIPVPGKRPLYIDTAFNYLTHLPLDKMAAILADDIFKCIFLNENDRIPIQI